MVDRATSFSCSLGSAMSGVLLPLLSELPVVPRDDQPHLFCCENDHDAVTTWQGLKPAGCWPLGDIRHVARSHKLPALAALLAAPCARRSARCSLRSLLPVLFAPCARCADRSPCPRRFMGRWCALRRSSRAKSSWSIAWSTASAPAARSAQRASMSPQSRGVAPLSSSSRTSRVACPSARVSRRRRARPSRRTTSPNESSRWSTACTRCSLS